MALCTEDVVQLNNGDTCLFIWSLGCKDLTLFMSRTVNLSAPAFKSISARRVFVPETESHVLSV